MTTTCTPDFGSYLVAVDRAGGGSAAREGDWTVADDGRIYVYRGLADRHARAFFSWATDTFARARDANGDTHRLERRGGPRDWAVTTVDTSAIRPPPGVGDDEDAGDDVKAYDRWLTEVYLPRVDALVMADAPRGEV